MAIILADPNFLFPVGMSADNGASPQVISVPISVLNEDSKYNNYQLSYIVFE